MYCRVTCAAQRRDDGQDPRGQEQQGQHRDQRDHAGRALRDGDQLGHQGGEPRRLEAQAQRRRRAHPQRVRLPGQLHARARQAD